MAADLLAPLLRLLSWLPFESLHAQFMQRAVLEALVMAPLCAMMGTLTIQFRMAFFSDAIAHSAFTGVAIGLLFGINPWFSVIVFGVFMGILTARIRRKADLAMDTSLGVLFSSTVALGLAIISSQKGLGKSLPNFLYGDILSVNESDILAAMFLFVVVFCFLWFFFNKLVFIGLHEHLAKASEIPADTLELLFAGLLALVVAFSIKAVGILLVTALLIIPSAAAGNISRSLRTQVWVAVAFSLFSSLAGLASSVTFDTATGASIILWAAAAFVISLMFKRDQA